MTNIEDINAGWLHRPPNPRVCCHCLLLSDPAGLALVDTGIGLEDVRDPFGRIGSVAVEQAGFEFDAAATALRKLESKGIAADDVTQIVLTHLDPDHTGGLTDFPDAIVHVAEEELAAMQAGDPRYRPPQFTYGPKWSTYGPADERWYGLEARRVNLNFSATVLLIPLFGHTAGHCGVAVGKEGQWTLHVGDAYYLRAELTELKHPVDAIAAAMAVDDSQRRVSLENLRRLHRDHSHEVRMTGYHDLHELTCEVR